jgi:hypothetical protein
LAPAQVGEVWRSFHGDFPGTLWTAQHNNTKHRDQNNASQYRCYIKSRHHGVRCALLQASQQAHRAHWSTPPNPAALMCAINLSDGVGQCLCLVHVYSGSDDYNLVGIRLVYFQCCFRAPRPGSTTSTNHHQASWGPSTLPITSVVSSPVSIIKTVHGTQLMLDRRVFIGTHIRHLRSSMGHYPRVCDCHHPDIHLDVHYPQHWWFYCWTRTSWVLARELHYPQDQPILVRLHLPKAEARS